MILPHSLARSTFWQHFRSVRYNEKNNFTATKKKMAETFNPNREFEIASNERKINFCHVSAMATFSRIAKLYLGV